MTDKAAGAASPACPVCGQEISNDPGEFGTRCIRTRMGAPSTAAMVCYRLGYERLLNDADTIRANTDRRLEELKTRAAELEEELVALRSSLRQIASCECKTGLGNCGCVTCIARRTLGMQAGAWRTQCPMCRAPYATNDDLKRSHDTTLSDDLQPWEAALCWIRFSDGPHSVAPERRPQ